MKSTIFFLICFCFLACKIGKPTTKPATQQQSITHLQLSDQQFEVITPADKLRWTSALGVRLIQLDSVRLKPDSLVVAYAYGHRVLTWHVGAQSPSAYCDDCLKQTGYKRSDKTADDLTYWGLTESEVDPEW